MQGGRNPKNWGDRSDSFPLPLCSCILVVSESSNCLVANAVVSPPVDYDQDEKRFLWQDSIVGENKLNYEYPSPLKSSVAVGG